MGGAAAPQAPQAPQMATQRNAIQDFVNDRPLLFASDQQFQAREAQQQMDLINQFAAPMGQATRRANEAVNPETTGMQATMFDQINQGLTGEIDPIEKAMFESNMRANMGTNVGSEMGGTAMARELFGLGQQKQHTAQNQALSFIGRTPVNQAQNPNVTSSFGQFTPGQSLNFASQNNSNLANIFGTQANIFGTQQQAATAERGQNVSMINSGMSMAGSMVSSRDFKENIKKNKIDSIDIIKQLDIVEFDYQELDNKHHIGIIIEDSPEILATENGKAIDMVNVIGILLDANKKLIERIEVLEGGE